MYLRAQIRLLVYGQQGIADQAKAPKDTTEDPLGIFCSDLDEEKGEGTVYSSRREMASEQPDKERPKYEARRETQSDAVFKNIEQAASYWKALWESEGSRNKSAEWLDRPLQVLYQRRVSGSVI